MIDKTKRIIKSLHDKRSKAYKKQRKEADDWRRWIGILQRNPIATIDIEWKLFQKYDRLYGNIRKTEQWIAQLKIWLTDEFLRYYRSYLTGLRTINTNSDLDAAMRKFGQVQREKLTKAEMKLDGLIAAQNLGLLEVPRKTSKKTLINRKVKMIESGKVDIYDDIVEAHIANIILYKNKVTSLIKPCSYCKQKIRMLDKEDGEGYLPCEITGEIHDCPELKKQKEQSKK